MPNQIARLRKKGFLEEAHARALDLMNIQSEDIRIRRAYAWVLYDLTKRAIRENNAEQALVYFENYEALELTPEDVMLHENFTRLRPKAKPDSPELLAAFAAKQEGNYVEALEGIRQVYQDKGSPSHLVDEYAWGIFRLLKHYLGSRPFQNQAITSLLNEYREIAQCKASVLHSQFLRLILKIVDIPLEVSKDAPFDVLEYLEWWNIDNLRSDDFKPFLVTVKGKEVSVPPVAATLYSAIASLLINRYNQAKYLKDNSTANQMKERMNLFYEKIVGYIRAHPNYDWLPSYRLKMEIALGIDNAKAEKELNSLIRKKRKEYWVWELLGDFLSVSNPQIAVGSYTKSLSLKTPEEYLWHIRHKLARLLLQERRWIDAKTENEIVKQLFEERGWDLVPEVIEFSSQDWYEKTRSFHNNNNLYRDTKWKSEEYIFGKAPTYTGIVTRIDFERGIAFFVVNKEITGRFNLKEFQRMGIEPGKTFDFALEKKIMPDKTIQFKATRLMPPTNAMSLEIAQPFQGQLKINPKLGFGFVGIIYVHPDLIKQKEISNYQNVEGLAVVQFDPKKQTWGWSAVAINSH